MRYVIIGNGVAGVCAAEAIRSLDSQGEITMIGDETFGPYCRPMISMLLARSVREEQLLFKGEKFYSSANITPVLGQRARVLDTENRQVMLDGNSIPFDRLLIATGADPKSVKVDGHELENIFVMRTKEHVQKMLSMLSRAKKAVVLGGGLVGFKAACGLFAHGLSVKMLVSSNYPLSQQVDELAGSMIREELERQGLEVLVGSGVARFDGDRSVRKVITQDGSRLDCDLVVAGKGVFPACSFIPKDKIWVDAGILVNEHLETSETGVFAAGDVAESLDLARQIPWVNAIWPEAAMQGRIAGMNMAGRRAMYKGSLSRNIIRIFDLDVMTAGITNPPDGPHFAIYTRTNPTKKTYRKLVFCEDRLVGFILVNEIEQGGILHNLIVRRIPFSKNQKALLSPGFNAGQVLGL